MTTWRDRLVSLALLCAGIATFTELYAIQSVLPAVTAELGGTASDGALTVSAATGGLALSVFAWAWVGGRIGRAAAMKWALTGAVATSLLSGFAPTLEILTVTRFLSGAFLAGVPVLAVAYVHERVPGPSAARYVAAYVAGTTVGGAAGRVLAGALAAQLGWRGALTVVTGLSVLATAVFIFTASNSKPPVQDDRRGLVRAAVSDRALWPLYVQTFALTAVFVAVYNYLGFRLEAPPFVMPAAAASLVFLVYAAGTVTSQRSHRWVTRWGYRRVAVGGLSAVAVGLVVSGFDSLPAIIVALVLITGGFFLCHAGASAQIGLRAQSRYRAQASATYTVCFYAGSALGGWALGLALHWGGWWAMVVTAVVLTCIAAVGTAEPRALRQAPNPDGTHEEAPASRTVVSKPGPASSRRL